MKTKFAFSSLLFLFMILTIVPVQAARIKIPKFKSEEEATAYFVKHYNKGSNAYNEGHYHDAIYQFYHVTKVFPSEACTTPAYFYIGVSCMQLNELEFANMEFSNYLRASGDPEFFEETLQYKFNIARSFHSGAKRRIFTCRYFPRCLNSHSLALEIYDEIITAAPNHELAIRALYAKGLLLQEMGEYGESIDAFQAFIRRFPKNEWTPICYLKIAEVYRDQSVYEFQNPDILALAEVNARKFQEDFPRDPRVQEAEAYVRNIEEIYAKGLCDVGLFYERLHRPASAVLYYRNAINDFPQTEIAAFCRSRILELGFDCVKTNETVEKEAQPLTEVKLDEESSDS